MEQNGVEAFTATVSAGFWGVRKELLTNAATGKYRSLPPSCL